MPVVYASTKTNWSSTKMNNGKVHGTRSDVHIKNDKGYALKQMLNARGDVIHKTRRNLKPSEIKTILKGKFIPNLWKCGKMRKSGTRKASHTNSK